jgi:hypothetical protein
LDPCKNLALKKKVKEKDEKEGRSTCSMRQRPTLVFQKRCRNRRVTARIGVLPKDRSDHVKVTEYNQS